MSAACGSALCSGVVRALLVDSWSSPEHSRVEIVVLFVPTACLLGKCCYRSLTEMGSRISWTLDQMLPFISDLCVTIIVRLADHLSIVFFRGVIISPCMAAWIQRHILWWYQW